jgi:preprotein translocase subunit SecA
MDYLRTEVRLRTVAQKDPLMEFKHEAFALFHLLSQQIRLEIAKGLFQFTVYVTDPNWMRQLEAQLVLEKERSLVEELESANEPAPQSLKPSEPVPQVPVTVGPKVGRNDQCSCGSGRKYKKCCGNDES